MSVPSACRRIQLWLRQRYCRRTLADAARSYISAAEKISRLAVGRVGRSPGGDTFRVAPDLTQEEHIEGLPLGTRGGTLVSYTFPQDGEYDISIRLRRDRDEKIEGLTEAHEVEVLLDRASVAVLQVQPQRPSATGQPAPEADAHLTARFAVRAGPHVLGVTFPKKPSDLPETACQPYQAHFNSYRHPRLQPAIYSVSIVGPLAPGGPGTHRAGVASSASARGSPR